jgi:hypothetical protein
MTSRVMVERVVPVEVIDRDDACFPRERVDESRVEDFAELYRDGGVDALPPVVVVEGPDGRLLRADGEHRLCALEDLGIDQTRVAVITAGSADPVGLGYEIALERAVSARPLSRDERRTAVARLLQERPDLSDREIARLAGVSHQTVGRVRANGPMDQKHGGTPRPVSPDQAARKLLSAFEKLRQARGLGLVDWLSGGDRTGERFASALHDVFGDNAADQARTFSGWLTEAADLLEAEAGE